ncbi:LOW QUALITY PROTEIN: hypothetical protein PanWU01x14_123760 [Parasponia andersonii]|uniref:Uncharacterized protein n=1 Tax=Parasponia andersonii TaxID=3476 RepID=A0A2P5CTX1_PARAD|nr:LOW QUALITY PROTEIN: hypothetical protein PanWU01x14_123760 [Parasponia andersonii]
MANIQEHIDRYICNESWRTLFPLAAVENLDFYKSNNRLILLTLMEKLENSDRHDRPFRFESSWVNENDCMEIVNYHWGSFGDDKENDSFRDINVQLASSGDKPVQ